MTITYTSELGMYEDPQVLTAGAKWTRAHARSGPRILDSVRSNPAPHRESLWVDVFLLLHKPSSRDDILSFVFAE